SKYMRGILASANYPMHTSVLEGVNNKIKVIKRMAYGFLITHDPQPASRADMASEGLPRLHAPIQQTYS
ncbi:transposase, partial [Aeromonas caviae]|uniref:transposase n=1 Tax=Aeromonas caviae TaxID=648 RepID=UPI001FB988D4